MTLALWPHVAALIFGYLLGSIPFGLLLTRFAGTADLRSIGSGNIGATNVLRTGRKDLAAATLLLDALKGFVAVFIAARYGPLAACLATVGAILGHVFPVWLRFRGGKGVATFIGCVFALDWRVGLAFAAIWLVVAAATRFSSAAALTACAAAPVLLWLFDRPTEAAFVLLCVVLIWAKHHANIARLVAGTESKIGAKG